MRVIFSKKCELAIQAVLYLSSLNIGETKNAKAISKALIVPKEFVSKVLQSLTKSGIVKSHKGKNGGFLLGKPSNEIRLIEIILAIDGPELFEKCVLGFSDCSDDNPCPLHSKWEKLRNEIYGMFSTSNLEDFKDITKNKIKNISSSL
jgi:Rrf2 family transcriptional regulator, iron-sulfur cluster assembly transcription factor